MTKKERDIQIALGIKHQYFIQVLESAPFYFKPESNGYYNIDTTDAVDIKDAKKNAEAMFEFKLRGYKYGKDWRVMLIK